MSVSTGINLPAGATAPDLSTGSVFFIGTATMLIRYGGFTILTDPNFIHMHEQVSVGYGLHATRLTNPAIDIADLPPIDLVVLSHFHGDHFDQVAEHELDKTLPIVTTPHTVKELEQREFVALHPLHTWESIDVAKGDARLRITSTPGKHGPPFVDLVLPEVMGSVLEFLSPDGETAFRIYITGDTLAIDELKDIPKRCDTIDIAFLHLGGTKVMGILVTMDGKHGVEVMRMVNPNLAIPIHYDDYDLFKSPLSEFQEEVRAAGLESKVVYLDHGDTYTFNVPDA